jgi:hypothetical protein
MRPTPPNDDARKLRPDAAGNVRAEQWRGDPPTQEVRTMRSRLTILAAMTVVSLALSASPTLAGSPAQHMRSMPADTMPPFACGATTLRITTGTLDYVTRSSETASGNWSMTGTITLSDVGAVDQDGDAYRVVGSAHFGFTYNAQTGIVTGSDGHAFSEGVTTFKFQFVDQDGGLAGSLNFVQHGSPNGSYVELSPGGCAFA